MIRHAYADLARSLASAPTRREVLRGVAGAGFVFANLKRPATTLAKKQSKAKLRRNEFGCVPIGEPCRASDAQLLLGRLPGEEAEERQKDKSRLRCA